MIDAILQQVSPILFGLKRRTRRMFLGQHQSTLRREGLEFDQLKEYQAGEGIHRINWAATARRGGNPLFVNTYYEEKEITVMLLVDLSPSMDFGSTRVQKRTLTAEISASLVYSALLSRDRIGLVGFTSQIECYYPPRRTPAYLRAIPEAILQEREGRSPANFQRAVEVLEQRIKIPSLLFLCSDFLTEEREQLEQALARLRLRHDLIALVITDPREQALPTGNIRVALRDLETGAVRKYCFSREKHQQMLLEGNKRENQFRHLFQKLGISYVRITPQSNYHADISQCFHAVNV